MAVNAVPVNAVGRITRKAFGGSMYGTNLNVWNALSPMHLPLPRSTGPYTIVRSTKHFSSSAVCLIFGTFQGSQNSSSTAGQWATTCCVEGVAPTGAVNAASNGLQHALPLTLGIGATAVPSAFTVQIMNPNALQTTAGTIYAGISNSAAALGADTDTWNTLFDKFISYQSPKTMSASKLALRGVQVDSYPLNPGPLSTFTIVETDPDNTQFTWSGSGFVGRGFAPIFVNNVNGVALEYLVTVEWRVRFDLTNPAASGHIHHPVASEQLWDNLTRQAESQGHGVRDIPDTIASGISGLAKVAGPAIELAHMVAQLG